MKKVLVRGGYSPFDGSVTPERTLARNLIGENTGNTVYLNSIFRLLAANGIEAFPDNYQAERGLFSDEEIACINEEFDAYLIPLADGFRDSFVKQMRNLTAMLGKLTIPCIVIGVCLRTTFEPNLKDPYPFDDTVKKFVTAVLEHSSLVGVRGNFTARYLERLGFREDSDFMAIGCPSMFTFGSRLQQKSLNLTSDSKLSVNFNRWTLKPGMEFLLSLLKDYPRSQYVPQNKHDLRLAYLGDPLNDSFTPPIYPGSLDHDLYKNDQVRIFLNPYTWIDSLAACDLSIGGRMHGNIVSVLAGTPAVFMPTDGRTRELCEYHCFPHVPMRDITSETTLESVLEKVDLQSHLKVQGDRYARFQHFLKANGLPCDCSSERQAGLPQYEVGTGIASIPREELVSRWSSFSKEAVAFKGEKKDVKIRKGKLRIKSQKEQIKLLREECGKLRKENARLEKKLNRKAVRVALKVADCLPH